VGSEIKKGFMLEKWVAEQLGGLAIGSGRIKGFPEDVVLSHRGNVCCFIQCKYTSRPYFDLKSELLFEVKERANRVASIPAVVLSISGRVLIGFCEEDAYGFVGQFEAYTVSANKNDNFRIKKSLIEEIDEMSLPFWCLKIDFCDESWVFLEFDFFKKEFLQV